MSPEQRPAGSVHFLGFIRRKPGMSFEAFDHHSGEFLAKLAKQF
jgi:hypothetical protein